MPVIEGTTGATKDGPLKTDHILFIASGAFHVAKPSDLLPELEGRLPLRVELKALTEEDFIALLTETKASLPEQYKALLAPEEVILEMREDDLSTHAKNTPEIYGQGENNGHREMETGEEKRM